MDSKIKLNKSIHPQISNLFEGSGEVQLLHLSKSDAGANVVEKFRKFSDSVWVSFEAVIIEKTLKEEWTNKNNFDDNYN